MDTDVDGLSDGAEVNQYGTNPKIQDSDGDTLSDGQEVNELKTSPLNKDTDGDGLFDSVDPAPLLVPSITPTLVPTTPAPPLGGVSMNCDGTYQRFRLEDKGSDGQTVYLEYWEGTKWITSWTYETGDPMTRHIEPEGLGFNDFGECRKLLVLPVRYSGSGGNLELLVYARNGTTLVAVLQVTDAPRAWFKQDRVLPLNMQFTCLVRPLRRTTGRGSLRMGWEHVCIGSETRPIPAQRQPTPPGRVDVIDPGIFGNLSRLSQSSSSPIHNPAMRACCSYHPCAFVRLATPSYRTMTVRIPEDGRRSCQKIHFCRCLTGSTLLAELPNAAVEACDQAPPIGLPGSNTSPHMQERAGWRCPGFLRKRIFTAGSWKLRGISSLDPALQWIPTHTRNARGWRLFLKRSGQPVHDHPLIPRSIIPGKAFS
jgi:hypothetical protein